MTCAKFDGDVLHGLVDVITRSQMHASLVLYTVIFAEDTATHREDTYQYVCYYGFMSSSRVFQLYSDGKHSPNLTCCQAPTPLATRVLLHAKHILTQAQMPLTSLPSELFMVCQHWGSNSHLLIRNRTFYQIRHSRIGNTYKDQI